MTLGTTTPLIDYVENGATLTHPIPFEFASASEIVCTRILNGIPAILVQGTDFTVSGGGTGTSYATGSVTKTNGGVGGQIFRIERKTPRSQPTDYTPGDAFPAETHEHALDRMAAVNQEQDVDIAEVVPDVTAEAFAAAAAISQAAAASSATAAAGSATAAGASAADADDFATQAGIYAAAAAAVPNRIYATTAAGIAATVDGNYFFVVGAGTTFATLWKNVAGVATAQNLALASAAAFPAMQADLARLAGGGDYLNLLHGLSPTITIVGGGAGAATLTDTADGVQVSAATFNQQIAITTNIKVGAPHTRLIATIKVGTISSGHRVGLIFSSGANYLALTWQNNGWLIAQNNAGATIPSQNLSTFATGETVTMQFDVTSTGEVYVTCQKGTAKRVCCGFTGVPISDVGLTFFDDTGASTAAFSVSEQAMSQVAYAGAKRYDAASLSSDFRAPRAASANYFAPYERLAPTGFTAPRLPSWFKVYKRPDARMFFTTVDLQPLLSEDDPTVFTQYVDIATGNDANAGTSAAPLKSLNVALTRADLDSRAIIKAKGGTYDFLNCCKGVNCPAAVLQLVSSDGNRVVSSMHDAGLAWVLGVSATYHATFTETVLNVFDALHLTSDGDYSILTLAASQAACEATAGTYFVTGTTIYVHASDGRAPDANIRVFKKLASGFADNNGNLNKANGQRFFENIHFEGGVNAFWAELVNPATTMDIYGKNCSFKYSVSSSPIVNGNVLAVWQNCIAAWNRTDGFHYNPIFGSVPATGVEVDCIGRWNGTDGAGVNNNSSNHGGPTIRVRTLAAWGDYHHAEHRGIHDILDGQNSRSWHLGIISRDSRNGRANFAAGLGGSAELMWNDSVTSSGATFDQEAAAGATIKDYDLVRGATDTGAGTITGYVP